MLHIGVLKGWARWKNYVGIAGSLTILFVIVNVLVNQEGQTIIWQAPAMIPGFDIKISLEEVLYNLRLSAQMLLLLTCFCLYSIMQDVDSVLRFLLKWAPRSALTLILTSLLIPLVRRRLLDAQDVLIARGACFERGRLFEKIKARLPLLKIALFSSLEGSWETVEALEARGYGTSPRTQFELFGWRTADILGICSGLSLLFLIGMNVLNGQGQFTFFPTLEPLTESVRLSGLLFIFMAGSAVPFAYVLSRVFHDESV